MTRMIHREMLLLAFAMGSAACDGWLPSAPLPRRSDSPTPLSVIAISPSTGSTVRPTQVTITGTGFQAGAKVTIGAMALTTTATSSTTIKAVIPAHTDGGADVIVTNPGGVLATLTGAFSYAAEEPVTLSPSTDVVDAGGEMSVSWSAPAARAGDWLGIFRVGESYGSYEDDWWVDTHGETSGIRTLTVPTRPGQYEFRYLVSIGYVDEHPFFDLVRSKPVTVR